MHFFQAASFTCDGLCRALQACPSPFSAHSAQRGRRCTVRTPLQLAAALIRAQTRRGMRHEEDTTARMRVLCEREEDRLPAFLSSDAGVRAAFSARFAYGQAAHRGAQMHWSKRDRGHAVDDRRGRRPAHPTAPRVRFLALDASVQCPKTAQEATTQGICPAGPIIARCASSTGCL